MEEGIQHIGIALSSPEFEIPNVFGSHDLFLLEVMRTDLSDEAPDSEVYLWFLYDETEEDFRKLDLVTADSDGSVEYCEFKQGEFNFDDSVGELSLDTGSSYALDRIEGEAIPDEVLSKIKEFLA